MHTIRKESLEEKISTFSQFGKNENGGITRLSLSKAALDARAEFIKRCLELGMEIKTDDMANIYATKKGTENLPAIVMGSHIDSVSNGGNYDGVLGVLAGLETVETLITHNITTRHPITVMIWTNEEGARFEPAMMSSGVITGKFSKAAMLASLDRSHITFEQALEQSGYKGEEKKRLNPDEYAGYLELHIEQGPILENNSKEIGIVEGVAGMVNYEFTIKGVSDHAGTTPQDSRKDALLSASRLITKLWDKLSAIDSTLVFTIGRFNLQPNIHTVIPEQAVFTLDARHKDPMIIQKVMEILSTLPSEESGCSVSLKRLWSRETIHFHKKFTEVLQKSSDKLGYPSMRLYSGAGHDAQYTADFMPSAMLFVPSAEGHSHCPEEYTDIGSIVKGTNVLLHALLEIDRIL